MKHTKRFITKGCGLINFINPLHPALEIYSPSTVHVAAAAGGGAVDHRNQSGQNYEINKNTLYCIVTVKLCTLVPPDSKINKLIPHALMVDLDPEGHCWALLLHSQQHELPSCMHPPVLLLEL